MFKHILVPLDGSELAESAIPAAVYFSTIGNTAVTLLHVLEPHAPSAVHGEHHITTKAEAERYLESVRREYFTGRANVKIHVHEAPVSGVARGISEHQTEFDHDLIIMCTHGKSGAETLVFGSIAKRISSLGTVPVLVVRPGVPGAGRAGGAAARDADTGGAADRPAAIAPALAFDISPILVPLDGSGAHESSIALARELADAVSAEILLLMVIPTLGTLPGKWEDSTKLLPHATGRLLAMAAEEAEAYLEEKRAAAAAAGIRVSAHVDRGDPVKVIAENAASRGARLVVLGTHGTEGISALWEGSLTGSLLSRIDVPALLIPLPPPREPPAER